MAEKKKTKKKSAPKKKTKDEHNVEKGFENFAEEMGNLGKRLERGINNLEKGHEKKKSHFGILWPLVSSTITIIVLMVFVWVLNFVNVSVSSFFIDNLVLFILTNLGLFFLISLFFGYMDQLGKHSPKIHEMINPIIGAAGVVVALWIIGNIFNIIGTSFSVPVLNQIAALFALISPWFFWLILLIGYIILLVKLASSAQEAEKMKKDKKSGVRRLFRSGDDKIIGGVCGGIAEYLDVDPVLIRLIWVIGTLISLGTGIIAYIIAWIIIPRNPKHRWED